METIYDTLFQNPAIDPDRECLAYKDRRFSFRDLRERTTRLANALTQLGVSKGDRVAALLGNCNEFVEAFYAITSLGALIVPLNWRLHPREHVALMNDCTTVALISSSEFAETTEAVRAHVSSVRNIIMVGKTQGTGELSYDDLLASAEDTPLSASAKASDDAAIIYTSGTTSLPKGAVLTHANYLADHRNVGTFAEIDASSRNLQVSPLYHAACMHTFMHVTYGGRTILMQKFEAAEALRLIEAEQVTYMFAVPTAIYSLLDHPDLAHRDHSTLKTISFGAAPMSDTRLKEAIAAFGYVFIHAYGLTESSSHSSLLGKDDHARVPGSVGRGLLKSELRVVGEDGKPAPAGSIGEILVRGPQVMSRYWNRPDATAETLIDGWLHTGDLGRTDSGGFIYVVDRKRDMIISGGVNIYPREIEEVIAQHPAVSEVAVYGIPDDRWGESIAAAIVLRSGRRVEATGIADFVQSHLARFKIPKKITFMDELPRNPSGKVLKRLLRDVNKTGHAG